MVEAQGGDVQALDAGAAFHKPRFRRELRATRSGYFASADCTKIGWAVQRLGAGRERAGEPVEAHAGIEMHVKLGADGGRGAASGDAVRGGRGAVCRAGAIADRSADRWRCADRGAAAGAGDYFGGQQK